MLRNSLITLALLAGSINAYATGNVINVDERAMKGTEVNLPRSVTSPANAVNYTGTNVGGPQWDRPFADGTCCSGLGPVRYSVQEFNVSANDTCDVTSVQNGWDGYLFVYRNSFDPLAQTVNFVAGDDDGTGGIGTSDIIGVNLQAATTYIAVTTGFAAGDEGSFTNTINCPTATVTLGAFVAEPPVPAPTMSAAGLAVLGLLMVAVGLVVVRSRGE